MVEVRREFLFKFDDRRHISPACHLVRIFENASWNVVVITDRSSQFVCSSITNSIEECANRLLEAYPELKLKPLIWIEHYDEHPEEWDIVTFDLGPHWKRITKNEAEDWAGSVL